MTSGFISGVGVMIVALQVLPFLGAPAERGNPLDSIRAWPDALSDMDFRAFGLAVITVVICGAWPKRWRDYVPATAGALVCGILLGTWVFDRAPRIGEIVDGLPATSLQALDVLHRVPGDHFVAGFDDARPIAARLLKLSTES